LEVDEVHQVSELSDEQSYAKTQLMVKPKESKVLGLKWYKQSDMLKISFPSEEVPAMKRGILSKLAKIYDPLGLVSPLTLEGKLLFRDVWDAKLPWDVEINKEQLKRWRTWEQSLPVEEEVPRSVAKIQAHPSIQWRHVPTKDNPADIASRGGPISSSLWQLGPEWLSDPAKWPDNSGH
jgi:hypothetical protein